MQAALSVILLCFLLGHIHAKKCPSPDWLVDSISAVKSNGKTAAAALNQNAAHVTNVRQILSFMDDLGERQLKGDPSTGGYWPCERVKDLEARAKTVDSIMRHQGFPQMFECLAIIGESDGDDKERTKVSKKLFDNIVMYSRVLAELAPSFLNDYGLGWKYSETLEVIEDYPADNYRSCKLAKMLSYRYKKRWSITALYSNKSADKYIRSGRGTFSEAIEFDPVTNELRPVQMSTPICNKANYVDEKNGTAVRTNFQGLASTSYFQYTSLADNPGIQVALQRGGHQKELVQDSDTISNDALVLLPALLALVPIGLFQDVSLSLTIIYIIATDIISVMPLLIKGIELMVYGSREHRATVSYFYGGENDADFVVAETWCALCSMRPFVRKKGFILMLVAVSSIVVGIMLEVLTRYLLQRYKKQVVVPVTSDFAFVHTRPQHSSNLLADDGGGLLWHRRRARTVGPLPGIPQ